MQRLLRRVAAELTATFASSYTDRVALADALRLKTLTAYARQATGSKYLIIPASSACSLAGRADRRRG